VLAATHDGELVDLLDHDYVVCHLGDAVGPNGLVFDYRLLPGPATSRNAITLLKLNGAPKSVVSRALELAARLALQRQ
jgi:DNA mismatch repair ATPase MutS